MNQNKRNKMKTLEQLITDTIADRTIEQLALGWLRYEELRRFSVAAYQCLVSRNLEGENFDEMVTAEMLKRKNTNKTRLATIVE
jgi:hypothetical protein